jgi:hypothetical protein
MGKSAMQDGGSIMSGGEGQTGGLAVAEVSCDIFRPGDRPSARLELWVMTIDEAAAVIEEWLTGGREHISCGNAASEGRTT